MCYISLKSNWTKHRKAFIFPEKKLSRNGAQKILSFCPFNMSEAGMCILKKKKTKKKKKQPPPKKKQKQKNKKTKQKQNNI